MDKFCYPHAGPWQYNFISKNDIRQNTAAPKYPLIISLQCYLDTNIKFFKSIDAQFSSACTTQLLVRLKQIFLVPANVLTSYLKNVDKVVLCIKTLN